ncbi:protein BREAST CANCER SUSCEPTIBILITY 1-like protein [Hibiscus syriacus]|uniref:Protein BREAST CANCER SUSCEPTIBILITY 1-like protein n=1 Tax=Hibiscus syriacus TaxID=106335 RepID=A0A6A3B0R3_HIBSY|nr:protein BREAST CANCER SUSCEPTIBILITY 1-like protein [Hibiscus syriacus]
MKNAKLWSNALKAPSFATELVFPRQTSVFVGQEMHLSLTKMWLFPAQTQIHAFSIRHGVPFNNPDIGKHLIYNLVSFSAPMSYPHSIFSCIQSSNVFTWNTMIRGYAERENPEPALQLYLQMRASCIEPDTHTYPSLLEAVAKLTDLRVGKLLIPRSYKVFELMSDRDIVAWNSVINGFALNEKPNEALTLFREMLLEGPEPDGYTVLSLLSACAELGALSLGRRVHVYTVKVDLIDNLHVNNALLDLYAKCGNIREARSVFDEMKERNAVSWSSMIVGLAVNGFGEEALELFKDMERVGLVPSEVTFVGVLCACSHCGMVDEGEYARAKVLQLESGCSGDYMLLSNLYASEKQWSDVHILRTKMLREGVKKVPGYSIVEFDNHVYEFVMGDRSHPKTKQIYAMLAEITKRLRLEVYTPDAENVLADIEEEEKQNALSYHCEKIAVAFMLIKTAPGTPIRIVKNLRICADCHLAIKLI